MKSRLTAFALAFAFAAGVTLGVPGTGSGQNADQLALRAAAQVKDPAARVQALRKFITERKDSPIVPFAHQLLAGALAEANAPIDEFTAAVDAAAAAALDPGMKLDAYAQASEYLATRENGAEQGLVYGEMAKALLPKDLSDEEAAYSAGQVYKAIGACQLKLGKTKEALVSLDAAAKYSPDDQGVALSVARAHEKLGDQDKAIAAYITAAGVFGGDEKSGVDELRALYVKKHGSDKGLAEQIAAAKQASFQKVALDSRRVSQVAPAWELPNPEGGKVTLADFKGKIVVMDFWGSWCPPCRMELPIFQKLYLKYKDKGVVFLGVNWERGSSPDEQRKLALDFMTKNNYTFPVVFDHDKAVAQSYTLRGYPTVYIVDAGGTMRFKNVGFEPTVEQILEAQIETLLAR